MNKVLSIILFMFMYNVMYSQDKDSSIELVDSIWVETPQLHRVDSSLYKAPIVVIQDYRYVNFIQRFSISMPYTKVHKIIKVNTPEGVEQMENINLIKSHYLIDGFKIRVISPDSQVQVLKKEEVNFHFDKEGFGFKASFSDLEVGSEIEFSYSTRPSFNFVKREYYQDEYPILNMRFEITPADNVSYFVKSYNGLNFPTKSEHTLTIVDSNIEAMSKGYIVNNTSQLKRVDYKVKNIRDIEDQFTWENISKAQISRFETSLGGNKVSKFLKRLELDSLTTREKLIIIENTIKRTIKLNIKSDFDYGDLGGILKNKISNPIGLYALYLKCFKLLNIKASLVIACSRFNGEIDLYFPHTLDLEQLMIYVEELDMYLSPLDLSFRLGFPPPQYGGTMALNILTENTALNSNLYYKDYEFRRLPVLSSESSKTQVNQYLRLNNSLDSLQIKTRVVKTGNPAFTERYTMKVQTSDIRFQSANEEAPFITVKSSFKNEDIEKNNSNPRIPLIEKSEHISKELVIKDEDHLFIELGKLMKYHLSQQIELQGVQDVLITYPLSNLLNVNFYIPEGYSCENLNQLPKSLDLTIDDKSLVEFNIQYSIENNILKVNCKEAYHTLEVDSKYYSRYKSISEALRTLKEFVLILKKQ